MLDPWIIEEIKRREQRGRIEQPVVQIPVRGPEPRDPNNGKPSRRPDEEETPRGVEIIELGAGGDGYGW